jgi:hypothetical protein
MQPTATKKQHKQPKNNKTKEMKPFLTMIAMLLGFDVFCVYVLLAPPIKHKHAFLLRR